MGQLVKRHVYEDLPPTVDQVFEPWGQVLRRTYRREWIAPNYRIRCGRYSGMLLSEVASDKWLRWALEGLRGTMPPALRRALIDQYNSLHT